jgi:hypothetical protein
MEKYTNALAQESITSYYMMTGGIQKVGDIGTAYHEQITRL